MTFPNYPDKHQSPSLLNPQDIVDYRRRLGRLPEIGTPLGALFCLERGLPRRMRWRIPVHHAGSMLADVYRVKRSNGRLAVLANFGGGAPIVAELAEELAALGVMRMILITWGGALQRDLKAGDIVVCDRAIRDEGTSHHYLPPGRSVDASHELADRLQKAIHNLGKDCKVGTTWTTDAPYRETLEEVCQYQKEGVQVVEMESAGLFAIGQVRGVQTASVVVVMDSLANLCWEVPPSLSPVQKSLETVYTASVGLLSEAW